MINNYQLLSTKQTAHILGLSIDTLNVWRSTGRYNLPFVKIGSKVMYRLSDVEQYIENNTVKGE